MNRKGDIKNLVRNLRKKENEKLMHIGNSIAFSKREKSKESPVRSKQNSDTR